MMESKMKHTPEPWRYRPNGVTSSHFESEICDSRGIHTAYTFNPEDARRIVVCVNACAGISTELLEQHGITAVLAPRESSKVMAEASLRLIQSNARQLQLTAQRDELLAALKEADLFIKNGIDLGFIRIPDKDTPDRAHKIPGIVSSAIAKCEVQS